MLEHCQETVESEGKADEETYDKFKCWCHENTDAKTKAAAEAETTARELKARVEELAAQSERLKGEIEKTEDEVAKNEAALDTATELRKQNKEYLDYRERLEGDLSGVKSPSSLFQHFFCEAFLYHVFLRSCCQCGHSASICVSQECPVRHQQPRSGCFPPVKVRCGAAGAAAADEGSLRQAEQGRPRDPEVLPAAR